MENKNYNRAIYLLLIPVFFTIILSFLSYYNGDSADIYSYRWWIDDMLKAGTIRDVCSYLLLLIFYLIPIINIILLFVYSWRAVITGVCTTLVIVKTKKYFFAIMYLFTLVELIIGAYIGLNTMMSV